MNKPKNPFRKGTLTWKVMEGDWEDLTPAQIAEVLDVNVGSVHNSIGSIKRKTGYLVPHTRGKGWKRRK